MGKCPKCEFDGTQSLPEDLHFPDGYYPEKRIRLKEVDYKVKGRVIAKHKVWDLDKNGRPQWDIRYRCPACGHTEMEKKTSSKADKSKGSDQ